MAPNPTILTHIMKTNQPKRGKSTVSAGFTLMELIFVTLGPLILAGFVLSKSPNGGTPRQECAARAI
jgi:hypothetical protein